MGITQKLFIDPAPKGSPGLQGHSTSQKQRLEPAIDPMGFFLFPSPLLCGFAAEVMAALHTCRALCIPALGTKWGSVRPR